MNLMKEKIYNLIVATSCEMSDDVSQALNNAYNIEVDSGNKLAADQLGMMLENIKLAKDKQLPLCQDTGLITFYIEAPLGFDKCEFRKLAKEAVIEATNNGLLRKNSVSPVTGINSGTNLGPGNPAFYWEESDRKNLKVTLLLKGGGSENVGTQYSLPDESTGAGRDMDGVKSVILDAVKKAKGKGCPPSVISVCVGGDRATGYAAAKKAFVRKIGERSLDPEIAEIEEELLSEINSLGIGAMGLGGAVTSLDLFITILNRHPASFFVTISQMCWSYRRREMVIDL